MLHASLLIVPGLHLLCLQDQEARPCKPPPASCRAQTVQQLVAGNGAPVYVRLRMSAREAGDGIVSHIVKVGSPFRCCLQTFLF